eukprot:TRINITY_DN11581_c0_g1_i2.p1 TRINITY_DN11581_c0_g1~~TRINITY_DN11581_c0_g1_i2.p1  ORF type:complete len:100 (-),score=17.76 TRINITY_DN11581_c0_g1_i2:117-416(-)
MTSETNQLKNLPKGSIEAHNIMLLLEDRVIARLRAQWTDDQMPQPLRIWKELTPNALGNRVTEVSTGKVNKKQVCGPNKTYTIATVSYTHLTLPTKRIV